MQTIKLDISAKNNVQPIYVKQRDVGHKFSIELYENGVPYTVDENNTFAVWYSGASGEGNYTKIGDETACVAEGNKIIVQMIMQMLQNPGDHEMCVVMYGQENEQKGFWNVAYYVEEIPGADSEGATEYYNAFLDAQKKAEEAADRAEDAAARAEAGVGASIIVGIDEGEYATHTAAEIYDAMQNHQIVVFRWNPRTEPSELIPIRLSTPSVAVFSKPGYPTEFDIFDIEIDNSGTISYNTHFSSALLKQAAEKVETDLAPVSYLPQTLSPEQQAQARANIGIDDVMKPVHIICDALGSVVSIQDASDAKLQGLTIYGKTTQNGTPTPDVPAELSSIIANGSITVNVIGGNEAQSMTIATHNGLRGVPVASGGNYTDANGQQWLCDEVDLERGVYVQRIDIANVSSWKLCSGFKIGTSELFEADVKATGSVDGYSAAALCDKFLRDGVSFLDKQGFAIGYGTIYARIPGVTDVNEFNSIVGAVNVQYGLATPIEKHIAGDEILEYQRIHSNFPNTIVTNDAGATMKIKYIADAKTYIDNKFAELATAIVNNA